MPLDQRRPIRRLQRRRTSLSSSNEGAHEPRDGSHPKRRRGANPGSLPRGQTVTSCQGTCAAGNGSSNAPQSDPYAYSLSNNLATSKTVEYELGRLVCQALNMVGELVTLNTDRFEIRTTTPPTTESLSISRVHATLHQALDRAAGETTSPTPSNVEGLEDSTPVDLDDTQVQEIGNLFSRNPSALQPIIRRMWYTNNRCPDVSAIISPPSLLVS